MHWTIAWFWLPVWTCVGAAAGFLLSSAFSSGTIDDLEAENRWLRDALDRETITHYDREV